MIRGLIVRSLWKAGNRAEGARKDWAALARLRRQLEGIDALVTHYATCGLIGRELDRELRHRVFQSRLIALTRARFLR